MKKTGFGVLFRFVAYVDDLYLIATTNSYANNCKLLTSLHKEVLEWAGMRGMDFDKYKLIPFRGTIKHSISENVWPDIEGIKPDTVEEVKPSPDLDTTLLEIELEGQQEEQVQGTGEDDQVNEDDENDFSDEDDDDDKGDETGIQEHIEESGQNETRESQEDGEHEKKKRRIAKNKERREAEFKMLENESMRILGVWVDPILRWSVHVDKVVKKVQGKMAGYRLLSKSTAGASFENMRKLYLVSIQSVIAYACPVWFVPKDKEGSNYFIPKYLINRLEVLQRNCLRQVAGCYRSTESALLYNELYIQPIKTYLHWRVLSFQAQILDTRHWYALRKWRETPVRPPTHKLYNESKRSLLSKLEARHPYQILDNLAAQFKQSTLATLRKEIQMWRWEENEAYRKKKITKYTTGSAKYEAQILWDTHRWKVLKENRKKYWATPAYQEDGLGNAVEHYKGLSRAESSILIQCRTGAIGLNKHMHKIKASCPSLDPDPEHLELQLTIR